MNSPPRLLQSSPNPTARALLQAGQRERPRSSALSSTALALGVGGSVLAASTSAAATTGAVASAAQLAVPSLTLMVTKWVGLGMLGGLALAGTASLVSAPRGQDALAPSPVATAAAAVAGSRRATADTPAAAPSATPEAPPLELDAPNEPPPAAAMASKSPLSAKPRLEVAEKAPAAPASANLPNAQSLSREVAMIDSSRRALSSGNGSAALAQLDEYAASLRTGTLDREAQLLRIDALVLSGQRAAALSLAKRYLTSYPNDPHAARLRALESTP